MVKVLKNAIILHNKFGNGDGSEKKLQFYTLSLGTMKVLKNAIILHNGFGNGEVSEKSHNSTQ